MALIPVRVIIAVLGVYGCALVYTQRSAMSVAIVAMTRPKNAAARTAIAAHNRTYECAANPMSTTNNTTEHESPLLPTHRPAKADGDDKPEFDWNEKLQGIILGSQFYLYIFVPTIAGHITDQFGAKWVHFAGAVVPCVLSLLTPVGVRMGGVGVLIAIRIIDGAFHGCVYASLFSLYTKWLPTRERTIANGSLFFGGSLGSAVMYALAGWAASTDIGWPLIYYINACLYVPFFILWIYFCSNTPESNRHVSDKELQYIQSELAITAESKKRKHKTLWWPMITSAPVISSLFLKMASGWGYFLLVTKLPSYLATIFGIDIFSNGAFSASTNLVQGLCALAAAPVSNYIISKFAFKSLTVRKVFQSVAMIGPALCFSLIPVMGCNSTPVIILLLLGMFAYGFFTGGEWSTCAEYGPNSAGVLFGFSNSLSFLMGVVAPYIVGVLLDAEGANSRTQWNIIFYSTAGIYLAGLVPFLLFGTDQQQWWDNVFEDGDEEEEGEESVAEYDKIAQKRPSADKVDV